MFRVSNQLLCLEDLWQFKVYTHKLYMVLVMLFFVSGGPENVQLSPNTTIYTLNIGQVIGPVICSADCTPYCTFKWTKQSSLVVNGATLSLTVENKNHGGTYTCVATRGRLFTVSRSISLFVRCTHSCIPWSYANLSTEY